MNSLYRYFFLKIPFVILGLKGDSESCLLIRSLLSSMIALSQHEYEVISEKGLAMVTSILTRADWLREDILPPLIQMLSAPNLTYYEYIGALSIIKKRENLDLILNNHELSHSLIMAACKSFPIIQTLPGDKQQKVSDNFHHLILLILDEVC